MTIGHDWTKNRFGFFLYGVLVISLIVNFILAIPIFSGNVASVPPTEPISDPAELLCASAVKNDKTSNKTNATEAALAVIPDIYTRNMSCLSFSSHVTSSQNFDAWKAVVVDKYRLLRQIPPLNDLVPSQQPNRTHTFEASDHEYSIERYSMRAFDGDTIIFYQLRPLSLNGPLPAVLVVPGSGNQGVADVLGFEGEFENIYYQKSIAVEIVKRGYVVFAIENRGWGERSIETANQCGTNEAAVCSGLIYYEHMRSLGFDFLGLQTADALQVLNYMRSVEVVDRQRIAIVGLSLGAYIAMSASVLDPGIASTVLASGVISVGHTWSRGTDVLGSLKYFDGPDLASTLAPRPLYLSYGSRESLGFGIEATTLYSADIISEAYRLFNAEDKLKVVVHKGAHTYDVPSVLEFLDDTLKN